MERIIVRVPILSPEDTDLTYLAVEMLNKPGVLAGILTALARLGVNVLEGVHSRGEKEDRGYWLALIQPPKGLSLREIVETVERVDGVLRAVAGARRFGEIMIPPVELVWEIVPGMPVSIWRHVFLSTIYEGLTQAMGPTAQAVFYHQGREAGKRIYDYWRETMKTQDPRVLLEGAFHILQRLGWFTHAEMRELDPEEGRIVLAVKNSVEAYGRRTGKPVCYLLSGLFSGYASRALGRNVRMVEIRCQAAGDPYCLFTTHP